MRATLLSRGASQWRIGSLLVNPGGPGFGTEMIIARATEIFDTELLTRFDIVGMNPRGTGKSSPGIDCIDDYDALWASTDLTPDDDAAREAQVATVAAYAQGCMERTGAAIAHMTTVDPAQALSELWMLAGADGGTASSPGRPVANEAIVQTATIVSMYSDDIWPTFAGAGGGR